MIKQLPFNIPYLGVTVTVTPFTKRANMLYQVTLPTRSIFIEMNDDANWVEVPGGRTPMAEELGKLIEKSDV